MLFAETEEEMEKNIRIIFSTLGNGRGGLIHKISSDKKREILFRIMNKCILTSS